MPNVITVASFKGGVGKTTAAIHLAAYLQQFAPTILVDDDRNQSARLWARQSPPDAVFPFPVLSTKAAMMIANQQEYVIIDTPAGLPPDELRESLETAQLAIVPTTPDMLSLNALRQTLAIVQATAQAKRLVLKDFCRVLLTRIPPYPNLDGQDARRMLEQADYPLFSVSISQRVAFSRAALAGQTVQGVKAHGAQLAWEQYCAVGREVLDFFAQRKAAANERVAA